MRGGGDAFPSLTVGSPELPELFGHLGPKERRRRRRGTCTAGVQVLLQVGGPRARRRYVLPLSCGCLAREPGSVSRTRRSR